jgi:transcriptional regulator with PAS, ATPase and Fis domain
MNDPRKAIIAQDAKMRRVMALVEKIAATDINVLIRGESGAGKDLLADTIHLLSPRAEGPLLKIDCSSLPVDLVESELFGYEKGAFTDAQKSKPGRLEFAHKGTMVLGEISQLSLAAQAKLLRVIEDRQFQRLGGAQNIQIDTRIIALTNVDLEAAARAGGFRQDLFYRLNGIAIELPSLRERKRDIIPLARFFLHRLAHKHRKKITTFSPATLKMLAQYEYPGNVRELQNIIERAVILAPDQGELLPELLPEHMRSATYRAIQEKPTLAELEKWYIQEILEYTNWHKSQTAHILGIHRKTLLEKRKLYRIK